MTAIAGARVSIMELDRKLLSILHTQRVISIKEEEEVMRSNTLQVRIVGNSEEDAVLQGWS